MKPAKNAPTARKLTTPRHPSSKEQVFFAVLVGAVAFIVYSNTLDHSFVFDDKVAILNNPLVTHCQSWQQVAQLLKGSWRSSTLFTYGLTFYLAGFNARYFHAVNISIHVINSLLVFGVALLAARRWLSTETSRFFALAAGMIHATHPLYSEGVAYVWGRSSSLCATFCFGSLLLVMMGYEKARFNKYACFAGAIVCGVLAWKTKEEAITLPFLIAGFFALVGGWRLLAGLVAVPLLVIATRWEDVALLYRKVHENASLASIGFEPSLTPTVYFLTHVKESVFYYLKRFVFPLQLNVDPDIQPVVHIMDPWLVISILVLISLVVWGVLAWRKHRLISFALMTLLLSPLMAYALMPLADVVAEHRIYITGLGVDLLFAWILTRKPRYCLAALSVVTVVFAAAAIERNKVWANDLTLWSDAAQKSPGLARPHLNLGLAYESNRQFDRALIEYQKALSINPKLSTAYVNMGNILFSRGDLKGSEAALRKAIELSPNLSVAYGNLASIVLQKNQPAEALQLLEKAGSLEDSYVIHWNKGVVLSTLGRYREAAHEYQHALELRPDLASLKQQVNLRLQDMKARGVLR
ncbi:MAG: tetratricopeptide repeat protein [Acidobacteriia bacterium]|nr:tetratricopeptide repeat protein [Terriglobia bacterium]